MKRGLFFLIVLSFIPSLTSAQWKGGRWDYVFAYGVHGMSLFQSSAESNTGAGLPAVFRYGPDANWHSSDTGINFTQGIVTSFASLGRYFFAGLTHMANESSGPVYPSSNNGASWGTPNVAGPIGTNGKYLFGTYVGPSEIVRSRDSGSSWDSVLNISVKTFGSMGSHIFATSSGSLWRSINSGTNWAQVSYPLAPPVTFVVLDTIIFAGSSDGNTGLARSLDSGATWAQITFPHPIAALCTDGRNLWAGTADSGVYISTDTGQHWRNVSDGLKYFLQVTAMAVFDTMMIVATVSPGSQNYWQAWRPISEMVDTTTKSAVQEISQPGDTIEVYPNPAMESVTIISDGTSILGVTVLNVLGENVLDMPNLRESNITLDLSKLPSGTYFLQIQTANGSVLRKVVKEE